MSSEYLIASTQGGGRSQEDHPTVTALCGRGDLPINCGGVCVCVHSTAKLCLTLSDPMDHSRRVHLVHGISRAGILEWVPSLPPGDVWPFPTPWTIAAMCILSMGFPGREYWSGCHLLLQGIFPTQGPDLSPLHWQLGSSPLSHLGSPYQLGMVTMRQYSVLTPTGPFVRYETCVPDSLAHCTELSAPPGFICERICIRQGQLIKWLPPAIDEAWKLIKVYGQRESSFYIRDQRI